MRKKETISRKKKEQCLEDYYERIDVELDDQRPVDRSHRPVSGPQRRFVCRADVQFRSAAPPRSAARRALRRHTDKHNLFIYFDKRPRRQRQHVHRDHAQQVDANRHQLLPVQPSNFGPVAAAERSARRGLPRLVQIPLRLRRDVLHLPRYGRGDLQQRQCAHHHSLHGRTLPCDLPPLFVSHHVQVTEGGQIKPLHLAAFSLLCHPAGTSVRTRPLLGWPEKRHLHDEKGHYPTFF